MLNTQPTEKPNRSHDGTIEIVEVFDTIQGEGPFAGMPATFIRLAGCTLLCPLCDTDYTSNRRRVRPSDLLVEIWEQPDRELVVLTGGEPFRQDFTAAIEAIWDWDSNKEIQIETNGTLWLPGLTDMVTIVCSPKTPKVHPKIKERADCWKYIIQHELVDHSDGLPITSLGLGRPARPPEDFSPEYIFVQPCDEKDPMQNDLHLQAAVDSCLVHGYRLSVQTHKIANLP